jgi:hypothetical protein
MWVQREIKGDIKPDMGEGRNKLGTCQDKRDGMKVRIHGASVARFLEVTTSSVNWMARPEEVTELNRWDK